MGAGHHSGRDPVRREHYEGIVYNQTMPFTMPIVQQCQICALFLPPTTSLRQDQKWHCIDCINGIACINGIVCLNSISGVAQMALYAQLALCVLHK